MKGGRQEAWSAKFRKTTTCWHCQQKYFSTISLATL